MARQAYSLAAFNRGIVSRLGLARVDVKRIAMAAEMQTNWMPRVLGSMMLRPGLGLVEETNSDSTTRMLRFVFATRDTSLIELTDLAMRILIDDVLLERPSVSTAVTNGAFTTDVTGWTDNDEAGGTSSWVSPGYMQLVGNGTARAIRDQLVPVGVGDQNVEHALRIEIARGPVYMRVGSTVGGDEYIEEVALGTGTHSLAFTPTGDFNIRFFSDLERVVWVDSVAVESAGVVELPTPWAEVDFDSIRCDQSADVMFLACVGFQQRRIERRGTRPGARSWSIVLYQSEDGPFKIQNVTPTTLTPSGLSGNITVAASQPLFRAGHVGCPFSITSSGQSVSTTATASGVSTNSIRVIGLERSFAVDITGNASGSTVTLQRSYDNVAWSAGGPPNEWTADVATTIDDTLVNQIVYYRLTLTNRVAPDSVTMQLRYGGGSVRGVVRITAVNSSVSADAEVLTALGATTASDTWQEGNWSDVSGWPSAVRLQEGRLWWTGLNNVWGSVSDTFDSFDETVVGDSGPINRSIGSGPVDTINWILGVQRILLGADGAEWSVRSSSFDEPITPTNFHLKASSTQGSANVDAAQIDQSGFFVGRSKQRLYELSFDIKNYDYTTSDATVLAPELGQPGIVRMDAQRQPDTRLHCVLSDGTAMVLVRDKVEEVTAWILIETDGDIEDVCVLPALDGQTDDRVYYTVKRTINGSTKRFIEKWAQESDSDGGNRCMLADSYVTYSGAPTTTVSAPHLAGKQVVIWADGEDVGTNDDYSLIYTLDSSGQVTLPTAVSNYVVGLLYTARFKSTKLGLATNEQAPLNAKKVIRHLGLILADIHRQGLRYGTDFDNLDSLPLVEQGTTVSDEVREDCDEEPIAFPGTWTTNSRLCLQAQAPRPVKVLAATIDLAMS